MINDEWQIIGFRSMLIVMQLIAPSFLKSIDIQYFLLNFLKIKVTFSSHRQKSINLFERREFIE